MNKLVTKKNFPIVISGFFLIFLILHNLKFRESSFLKVKCRNSLCGVYPKQREIVVDNLIWQVLYSKNGIWSLLNAYLDTRQKKTLVRINAIGPKEDYEKAKVFCQFWCENRVQPLVVMSTKMLPLFQSCE